MHFAGHAVESKVSLPATATGAEAFDAFAAAPALRAIGVTAPGKIGLLSRDAFFLKYASHLGECVFSGRPISLLANWAPLVVDSLLPFAELLKRTHACPAALDAGFVVLHKGRFFGVGGAASMQRVVMVETRARNAELARMARALDESRKAAESANIAKSEFLANMSHELRTPLNVILGYTELIDEEYGEGNPALTGDVTRVRAAAHHLLGLINEVLDLAKVDAGALEVSNEAFSLDDWTAALEGMIAPLARRNGNEFRLCTTGVLGWAMGDPARLRQCVLNLASNACKFTRDGVISLSIEIDPGSEPRILRIGVSDTGIGIPPDKLASVFEAFSQADNSISRRYGGTGLGLTITKRLVDLMGGSIRVESAVGCGSLFEILVPAPCAPAAARAA